MAAGVQCCVKPHQHAGVQCPYHAGVNSRTENRTVENQIFVMHNAFHTNFIPQIPWSTLYDENDITMNHMCQGVSFDQLYSTLGQIVKSCQLSSFVCKE